jgi:hypothetical protein
MQYAKEPSRKSPGVVHQLADRALARIDLVQDLLKVGPLLPQVIHQLARVLAIVHQLRNRAVGIPVSQRQRLKRPWWHRSCLLLT